MESSELTAHDYIQQVPRCNEPWYTKICTCVLPKGHPNFHCCPHGLCWSEKEVHDGSK